MVRTCSHVGAVFCLPRSRTCVPLVLDRAWGIQVPHGLRQHTYPSVRFDKFA